MESEDFAYPSNLVSGPLHLQDDDDDYPDTEPEEELHSSSTKPFKPLPTPLDTSFSQTTGSIEGQSAKTSLEVTPDSHWTDQVDRGHFRANNVSTGSDLIQVTVEDLLISEEQVRTIKASGSYKKKSEHIQDHFQDREPSRKEEPVEQISNTSPTSSSPTSPISPRSITITATLRRAEDSHLRRLSFETEGAPPPKNEEPKNTKEPTTPTTTTTILKPASKALTPAQQREAEVDANIQKAIELHENNQLVEATRYFRLAAQSENPLGQLMYGLSLRHGWGCRPNPTEAIIYLQRAAEFAMGELKELSPRPRPRPRPPPEPQNNGTSEKTPSSTDLSQQQHEQERQQASKSSHTNLRRMGSLDRRQATVMARKELVMALYELGMSYLKGWGVHKDKSVAFTYFKIAADLGDPDSQNETALCYYDGIGVDKDMFQSAKYYRLAAAQGASHLGNSWIWKPKYDQYCAAEAAATVVAKPPSTSSTTTTTPTSRPRAQSDANNHSSRSRGSSKSRSSSPAPAVGSHQYTLSGIAAGLASVTATAGAIVPPAYSGSIRQSMSSPPPPSSSLPTSSSSSSITSLPTLVSAPLLPVTHNTSRFSHHSSQSVGHLPLATASDIGTPLAVQIGGFVPSSSSPLSSPPIQERRRHRWSLWGNKSSTALVSGKAN
ncbi:hypothetical protein CPB97_010755 [Podila verticillata]|nr:hypothetical protein CPB97_010755 [Podila verticillata]